MLQQSIKEGNVMRLQNKANVMMILVGWWADNRYNRVDKLKEIQESIAASSILYLLQTVGAATVPVVSFFYHVKEAVTDPQR